MSQPRNGKINISYNIMTLFSEQKNLGQILCRTIRWNNCKSAINIWSVKHRGDSIMVLGVLQEDGLVTFTRDHEERTLCGKIRTTSKDSEQDSL